MLIRVGYKITKNHIKVAVFQSCFVLFPFGLCGSGLKKQIKSNNYAYTGKLVQCPPVGLSKMKVPRPKPTNPAQPLHHVTYPLTPIAQLIARGGGA